jgi:two-component system NtrC family sensor kinase
MTGSRADARVLIVDDNPAIHDDVRKILASESDHHAEHDRLEDQLLGGTPRETGFAAPRYRIDSAFQGREAFHLVRASVDADDPYAIAIVDVRMPPGWDGVETIAHLWEICPRLQVILCTAFSDYTWHDMFLKLSMYDIDGLLLLKKPFEPIELMQMANALAHKWQLQSEDRAKLQRVNEQLRAEIADRERMSSELQLAQRLAASVGHELRNPLAAVRNANAFINKKIRAGAEPRVVQFLDLVERELNVCSKIIADLLDFARERRLNLNLTDLRALIDEAVSLIPSSGSQIVNALPKTLPMATVDRDQFRQVVINLVQNAAEALEPRGGGQITISGARSDGQWQLVIEDNGPGMSAELVGKVFQPLFTTKVKGTGLGLAIVANIIKSHHGVIRIESEPDRGTRCVIEWPEPVRVLDHNAVGSHSGYI